ncbi:MAG: class I SAM-dependent methyltransferase [Proteobacteria bacterium]|nr:class I SAM-dependent methyltransferase [Pseudomonadota bacterium]
MSVDIIRDETGNPVPWMTYPAIDFLKKNLNKNHEIFEFGCGSSTLFFADRVKKVVGIETREKWFAMLNITLRQAQRDNVEITLMEDGLSNELYENFAKNSGKKFDFIIVDSIKRFLSATNSINALKPGGSIILDDSERDNYKKIFDFFAEKNFSRQDFRGVAPGQTREKNTTIFISKI